MQKVLIYAILSLILAACAHKIDVQQGNVLSEEQLSRVKPGMETRQVRQILGTPMLIDPFHPERWDYFFSLKSGTKVKERYRATLFFSDDRLLRIERVGPIPAKETLKLEKPSNY